MSEQKYRPLKAGEIISNGDQYQDVCGNWIGYPARRFGEPISELATGRRPVAGETEKVVESEPAADESLPATAESLRASLIDTLRANADLHKQMGALRKERDELQKAYDSCLEESNLIIQDGEKAKAELAASQRMYMEAMTALEREVVQHRETNRRLDEVCGERNLLQDQLKQVCFDRNVLEEQVRARRSEISANQILDFLGVQIAVIPYLQAAVGKDAQRELTIAGRTLQMVHSAIENDRIGRDSEGKEVDGGKE